MTTDNSNNGEHPAATSASSGPRRSRLGTAALVAAGVLLGALGTATFTSYAHDGYGRMMHFKGDPDKMASRVSHRVERVLEKLDATPAQETQIQTIVARTMESVGPRMSANRGWRKEAVSALAAPSVDRAALEAIRESQLAVMASVSAEVVDAVAEIATILTPEQREALAKHMESRRGHGRHHRRGDGEHRGKKADGVQG